MDEWHNAACVHFVEKKHKTPIAALSEHHPEAGLFGLAHATTLEGPFVSRFRELARELGLAIVITIWRTGPAPRATRPR